MSSISWEDLDDYYNMQEQKQIPLVYILFPRTHPHKKRLLITPGQPDSAMLFKLVSTVVTASLAQPADEVSQEGRRELTPGSSSCDAFILTFILLWMFTYSSVSSKISSLSSSSITSSMEITPTTS